MTKEEVLRALQHIEETADYRITETEQQLKDRLLWIERKAKESREALEAVAA